MRLLLLIPLLSLGCLDVPGFDDSNNRGEPEQPAGGPGGGAGGGGDGDAGGGDDPGVGAADGRGAEEEEGNTPSDDGGTEDGAGEASDGGEADGGSEAEGEEGAEGEGGEGEGVPDPPEGTEDTDETCDDGRDNDGDILIDCGDPGCAETAPCAGDEGGEGEPEPPGPGVVMVAEFDTDGGTRGAQVDNEETQVGVFIPSGSVQFWDLDDPRDDNPDRTRRVEDVLFRDFVLSPKLPILVTASTNSDVQVWDMSQEGYPFVNYMVPERQGGGRGFMGRMRFNHSGTKVVLAQRGSAVVIQVAGGLEETFRENDFDMGNAPIAEFVGRDEFVVVLEDEEQMRLRIMPTIDDRGGNIMKVTKTPARGPECNGISYISGARSVDLLAYVCGTGAVHVRDPIMWSDAKVFRGVIGGMDMAEISPDGRFLAGTEGDAVHVFDVQTGGRATVDPGPRNDTYGPFMHWSDGGLLTVDREEHVVVYRVGEAPDRD